MAASILDSSSDPEQFSTNLEKPTLVNLDHLTCYEVEGEDAQTFLQGQLSNDINDITSQSGQLTSYCTPKGRMLATLYACKWQDKILLILSAEITEEVMKRLSMFVMRSKVTIKKSENTLLLGICNDSSLQILSSFKLAAPEKEYQVNSNDSLVCMNIPGLSPRYIVVGNDSLAEQINSTNPSDVNVLSNIYWQWLDIMAGIPNVTKNTQEAFVPQMTNMELINGVSFSKGCYPGQEIVARLHYIGQANRRMFRVEIKDTGDINAGDDIYTKETDQSVGKFVTTIKENSNTYSGLAVIRLEAVNNSQLVAGSPTGSSIQIMQLPYDVPTELKGKAT